MNEENYLMWLSRTLNCGLPKMWELIEYFGSAEEIYKAGKYDLLMAAGDRDGESLFEASKDGSIEKYMEELEKSGAKYIGYFNEIFPKRLKNIDDCPLGIYYKGSLPDENDRIVSMIGSRKCTEYGKQATMKLAYDLAAEGVVIVSGMALGIDSYSAVGTLKAGGSAVAVLGTAIDKCYPVSNRKLYEAIPEKGGCVISEYGPGEETYSSSFSMRNRLIAGLSDVLVVVEAEIKSGTAITVKYAEKYGRIVMAVPGSIFSRYSEGTNNLIRKGCPAALCCDDVLKALEPETDGQQEEKPKRKPEKKTTENRKSETKKPAANGTAPAGMSPEESAVDMALKRGKDSFEEIAAVTGIDEKRLRSVLTMMEIKNMISRMPGQRYIRL